MEYLEGEAPDPSENNSVPTASTSEEPSYQVAQVPVTQDTQIAYNDGTETACKRDTETAEVASDHGTQIPVDHGTRVPIDEGIQIPGDQIPVSEVAQVPGTPILVDPGVQVPGAQIAVYQGAPTDAGSGAQAAAQTSGENIPKGNEMSESPDEPPHDIENQFILRLPAEHAATVRKLLKGSSNSIAMKDKLKIDLNPDTRQAVVEIEDVSLTAKLVDLPCVVESFKSLDKTAFYKSADISQMLVCSAAPVHHSPPEEPVTSTDLKTIRKNEERQKKPNWKHGITPPLKNVRKKRFRKVTKKHAEVKEMEEISFTEYIDSSDVEKEVKRLLCSDAEAVSARWEVIADDETKEIECQGTIPSFDFASKMICHQQDQLSPEYDILRERLTDSSSSRDHEAEKETEPDYVQVEKDDKEEEDKEDEKAEDDPEEALERELQVKFAKLGCYKAKEGTTSMVKKIQKQIYCMEKKVKEIQNKVKRKENLIKKVENLTLKSYLQSGLKQLKIQESEKIEEASKGCLEIAQLHPVIVTIDELGCCSRKCTPKLSVQHLVLFNVSVISPGQRRTAKSVNLINSFEDLMMVQDRAIF
ncbi:PREDICTED: transcription initiation factor TFIID subunit 7-like [Chrysochloris asiatica]|uniref:Transcription initiation factor TFIID subunit 7-like n=1 Tax=Chrysochloris asiatica TaxID=185453 RepID=A0A9B0WVV9_CHRAS|nr:PREDICTED: transcription initiation factor TFIID subunit 7-like [Chrysochloris asiatica]